MITSVCSGWQFTPTWLELFQGAALVGRVFDKADIVLPIPTGKTCFRGSVRILHGAFYEISSPIFHVFSFWLAR